MGWPKAARWARIWWVRPVCGMACSSAKRSNRSRTSRSGVGGFAVLGVHYGAVAAVAIGAQWQVDDLAIPGRQTLHQGVVGLKRLALFELGIQQTMGGSRAGEDDHTAGLAIQTMHHPQGWISLFQECRPGRGLRDGSHPPGWADRRVWLPPAGGHLHREPELREAAA